MKELFYKGGSDFMGFLTILLFITTAWIMFHFIIYFIAKETKQEKFLHRIGYGKTMGLFTMIIGICGQMIGFYSMFQAIEEVTKNGEVVKSHLVFAGIKQTMIPPIYGILIYLFSLSLWFIASILIKKKVVSFNSA